jgi:hypothetical protein
MTALTEAQAVTVAQAVASDNGLTLDADALAAVVARLTTDLGLDEVRTLTFDIAAPFRIEDGKVVDILPLAHALSVIREHGKLLAKPVPVQDAPSPTTRPAKIEVNTPIAAFGRALAASHDAAVLREAETWPNPFLAGPNFNRTRQQVLTNKNPGLAARYKNEAEA